MISETEAVNAETLDLDSRSTRQILDAMHNADEAAVSAVGEVLPQIADAVDSIISILRNGGRLFYIGAGTSGRLGVLDASECPPTFNTDPHLVQGVIAGGDRALRMAVEGAEDDFGAGVSDLQARGLTSADALVGIAASGRTPYVLGAVAYARSLGTFTVGVTSVANSELARAVDVHVAPRTGPEVVAGSTRLKAGTAAKLILNMISTAAMVKLGYVHGNLMVNVVPTNQKLRSRALRLISRLAAVDEIKAADLLEKGRTVKVAVLMQRLGLSNEDADDRLRQCEGRLSRALETSKGCSTA